MGIDVSAQLDKISAGECVCGMVDIVSPFDIHAEKGGAERSIGVIRARGGW